MNINTVYILIKRELYERRQNLIWLTIFSTLILFFVCQKRLYTADMTNATGFIQFLFITIGAYFSGAAFWEFSSVTKMRSYLLIPAGNFEKVIAKVIFYIFGWWVLFIFAWLLAAIMAAIIYGLLSGNSFTITSIFSLLFSIFSSILPGIAGVFFIQSLGIFASCYFKKSALTKLTVSILLIMLLVGALLMIEISILVQHVGPAVAIVNLVSVKDFTLFHKMREVAGVTYFMIGIIMCGVSYLRLRETEAR
jgi:hypothetical protein